MHRGYKGECNSPYGGLLVLAWLVIGWYAIYSFWHVNFDLCCCKFLGVIFGMQNWDRL